MSDEEIVAEALGRTTGWEAESWEAGASAAVEALRAANRLAEPEHICGACGATTRERMADKA